MTYLLREIVFYLILAGITGFATAWFMSRARFRPKMDELRRRIRDLTEIRDELHHEIDDLTQRLRAREEELASARYTPPRLQLVPEDDDAEEDLAPAPAPEPLKLAPEREADRDERDEAALSPPLESPPSESDQRETPSPEPSTSAVETDPPPTETEPGPEAPAEPTPAASQKASQAAAGGGSDTIMEAAISRVLNLVPGRSETTTPPHVSKERLTENTRVYGRAFPIRSIPRMHEAALAQLSQLGLSTTLDLVTKCGSTAGIAEVAAATGLGPDELRGWTASADLMRVQGIDGKHAVALRAIGVSSPAQLVNQDVDRVAAGLAKFAVVVSRRDVEVWMHVARGLHPMVDH